MNLTVGKSVFRGDLLLSMWIMTTERGSCCTSSLLLLCRWHYCHFLCFAGCENNPTIRHSWTIHLLQTCLLMLLCRLCDRVRQSKTFCESLVKVSDEI